MKEVKLKPGARSKRDSTVTRADAFAGWKAAKNVAKKLGSPNIRVMLIASAT
jgi:hypothetical protein